MSGVSDTRHLVECVPNFSEGRNHAVLDALRAALASVPGIAFLDMHADASHHRSVFTFVGSPEDVLEAAFQAVVTAVTEIDLRNHAGEHPRIGAADVVPFVPLGDVPMETCVALAQRLGERLGTELELPVFLYGHASRRADRTRLSDIRRGGFEDLLTQLGTDSGLTPDFGPHRVHPTAGATAVGARPVLVAYNISLDTDDLDIARRIAVTVRTATGGLPAIQAHGFLVEGRAQVSMNLLDIDVTPLPTVFLAVEQRARVEGVEVANSEIVGLVPERAVAGVTAEELRLEGPLEQKILERRIGEAFDETS